MNMLSFPMDQSQYLIDQDIARGRTSEMMILPCTNGSDGFPSQAEFNRRMEHYIGRKKRSERTVVSEEELVGIHRLLTDPAAMRAEADVSHRTWVKKTFCLKSFINGTFVCHKDKGQAAPQPIASKEKLYFILKQAHASEGHGGRDKTAKAVKKTHSFIRKGLICLFLEVCPTCRARNDAVKKDKIANARFPSDVASPIGNGDPGAPFSLWGHPHTQFSQLSIHQTPHQQPFHVSEEGHRLGNLGCSIASRRPPTHTEAGLLFPNQSPGHIRSHTYPLLEPSYNIQPNVPEPPIISFEPQSPAVFQAFTAQNMSDLSLALQHQSICPPPLFSVQVDQPPVEEDAPPTGYLQNGQAYYHFDPQSVRNQNSLQPSNNIYDSVNIPFLLGSESGGAAPLGSGLFNSHDMSGTRSYHERTPSSLSTDGQSEMYLSSNDTAQHGVSADGSGYSYLSPYNPADSGSPEPSGSNQLHSTTRRPSFDKNHKQLSLQAPPNGQNMERASSEFNYGTSSGPSTAGSLWTMGDDMLTPMLSSSLHSALSTASAGGPEFGEERTMFPSS